MTNEEVQTTVHKYGVTSIPYYLAYSGPEAAGQLVGADVEVRSVSTTLIGLQENLLIILSVNKSAIEYVTVHTVNQGLKALIDELPSK